MQYTNVDMIGDNHVRYALIKHGKNPLIVFGVNPSTADDQKPDATMRKVMGFASRHGYDGFIMLNIYPQRATNIDNLPNEICEDIHFQNLKTIEQILSQIICPNILMAYGNPINTKSYLRNCLKDILNVLQPLNAEYFQLGELTRYGNPRHPSRPAYSTEFKRFDIERILK